MNNLTNIIQNNVLATLSARAPKQVLSAIKDASARVGVSFSYMMEQASAESSFQANAKARTSSASGLYQFIESTWMNMVEKHGAKHGIEVAGKSKSEILALRNDPETASLMAAEFAGENKEYLERNWAKGGKDIGSTELYFAHFMGAGGASAFLNARDKHPMQEAAVLFPKAAKANKNVFYDMDTGRARSMDEVYAFFDKKFSGGANGGDVAQLAQTTPPETMSLAAVKPTPSKPYHGQISMPQQSVVYQTYTPPTHKQSALPFYNLIANPMELMLMSQMMDLPFGGNDSNKRNSIF